jgi:hypothetical protein
MKVTMKQTLMDSSISIVFGRAPGRSNATSLQPAHIKADAAEAGVTASTLSPDAAEASCTGSVDGGGSGQGQQEPVVTHAVYAGVPASVGGGRRGGEGQQESDDADAASVGGGGGGEGHDAEEAADAAGAADSASVGGGGRGGEGQQEPSADDAASVGGGGGGESRQVAEAADSDDSGCEPNGQGAVAAFVSGGSGGAGQQQSRGVEVPLSWRPERPCPAFLSPAWALPSTRDRKRTERIERAAKLDDDYRRALGSGGVLEGPKGPFKRGCANLVLKTPSLTHTQDLGHDSKRCVLLLQQTAGRLHVHLDMQ